jgi:hypothetical protein
LIDLPTVSTQIPTGMSVPLLLSAPLTEQIQDILNREPDDETLAETEPEGLAALADTMNDLVIKHAPKRVQFSIPLRFGGKDGDIEIGVSGWV